MQAELGKQRNVIQTNSLKHKKKGDVRIKADYNDHMKIKAVLEICIHPLQIETHAANAEVNNCTGEKSDSSVKASELGLKQMVAFQNELHVLVVRSQKRPFLRHSEHVRFH